MAKKPNVITGQLTIFDALKLLEDAAKRVPKVAKDVASSIEESLDEYLKNGERIESLARKAFSREMKGLTLSEYEKKLFGMEIPDSYYLDDIVKFITKRIVNPILRSTTDYGENSEAIKFFTELIDFDFKISVADESYSAWNSYKVLKYRWRRSKDQLVLTISEDGEHFYLFGYRGLNIPKTMRQRIWKNGVKNEMFGDVGETLTWMILLTQYNRIMADADKKAAIEEVMEKRTYKFASILNVQIDDISRVSSRVKGPDGEKIDFKDRFEYAEKRCPLIVDPQNPPCNEALDDLLRYAGIGKEYVKTIEDAFPCLDKPSLFRIQEENRRIIAETKGNRPGAYIISKDIESALNAINPVQAFEHGYGKLKILKSFDENSGQRLSTINVHWLDSAVCNVVKLIWTEKRNVVMSYNYYNSLSKGSHARSFQTKKQTVQKYVKAAKQCILNERFGFIEFDESIDLEKVSTVAEQMKAFLDGYFNSLDLSDVSLRFRKLGGHKASGLYYPAYRCICIDIHSPSSFVHELGHCIDHIASDKLIPLSEQGAFISLWYKYSYLLDKSFWNLSADVRDRLKGSSKYNMSYYKVKTEVFARCFEMYVVRVLGFNNSICMQDEGDSFAYPKDDGLDEMIKAYFDKLLGTLHKPLITESDESRDNAA